MSYVHLNGWNKQNFKIFYGIILVLLKGFRFRSGPWVGIWGSMLQFNNHDEREWNH